MKTQSSKLGKSEKTSKRSKTRGPTKPPKVKDHPDLQDTFTQQTREQDRQHLMAEHELKMQARNRLHQARISSLMTQLNTQLYKIWNEAWLQRQKSMDQGFKEWLKVLMA